MEWLILVFLGIISIFGSLTESNDVSTAICGSVFGLVLLLIGLGKYQESKEKMEQEKILEEQRLSEKQQYEELELIKIQQNEAQKQKEIHEEEQRRIQNQKNSHRLLKSWKSVFWNDYTKRIFKTSAEIWGSYDLIDKHWNKEPMYLNFEYGKYPPSFMIDFNEAMEIQNGRNWWGKMKVNDDEINLFYYSGDWYFTIADINLNDAIILIEATKKRIKEKLDRDIERSKNFLKNEKSNLLSRHIPESEKIIVWNRDGGKCIQCGNKEKLEFDHIIPLSKGGSNTARNIQLLCEECNRKKSAEIR